MGVHKLVRFNIKCGCHHNDSSFRRRDSFLLTPFLREEILGHLLRRLTTGRWWWRRDRLLRLTLLRCRSRRSCDHDACRAGRRRRRRICSRRCWCRHRCWSLHHVRAARCHRCCVRLSFPVAMVVGTSFSRRASVPRRAMSRWVRPSRGGRHIAP